ncbi:MAG: hypothetical protein FWH38_02575, partial [Treponema sp.]|nr:hypothetical protein [Treponema sp.]
MIKVITAYTFELDDPAKAARSILDQVNPEKSLLKNSAALLFCHAKFFEMGVLEAVCKSLPFEVAGCTSQFFAIPGASGDIMLAVMVLTSDDIEFTAGISQPLAKENMDNSISALYKDMNSSSPSDPSLIFAFPPTMPGLTGDLFMSSLDRACGGLPVFGTLALDMDTRIRNP